MTTTADQLARHTADAAQSLALANHATFRGPLALTDAYDVVGNLHDLARRLPQLVEYLHRSARLTDPAEYFDDRGADPRLAILTVTADLEELRAGLDGLAERLTNAHNALGHLGRGHTEEK